MRSTRASHAYLEAFDPDERDMTKYVIGTISNLDAPLTPSVKGSRGLSAYLSGRDRRNDADRA